MAPLGWPGLSSLEVSRFFFTPGWDWNPGFAAFQKVFGQELAGFGFLCVIFTVRGSLFVNRRKRFSSRNNLEFLIFRQLQKIESCNHRIILVGKDPQDY